MLETKNPSGNSCIYFEENDEMDERFTYPGGSMLKGSVQRQATYGRGDTFQFKMYFHLDQAQQLYTSPVLDDVTFTFKPRRIRILFWQANAR